MVVYLNASIEGKKYNPIKWSSNKIKSDKKRTPLGLEYQWLSFNNNKSEEPINEFINTIYSKISELKSNKFEKIMLWILVSNELESEQCNIEISEEAIKKLNELKATLCIEYTK